MASFVAINRHRLQRRHYIRSASASNHWFDFSASKIEHFRRHHGDDFCLVVSGSDETDDAYVLPFSVAKLLLRSEYLDSRGRWVGTIVDDRLKLGKADRSYPVSEYRNAFHLLKS